MTERKKTTGHNTRLCSLAADVHLAVFAPAFTLSFHDSERSRKPPVPIASVVERITFYDLMKQLEN